MKIAIVVHRFLRETAGGAEMLAKEYALRLAQHAQVDVLTTTAVDYRTWENKLPSGEETVDGLKILRFPVAKSRDLESFSQKYGLNFLEKLFRITKEQEREFFEEQGPYCPELIDYIEQSRDSYDRFLFFTYLYYPTVFGIEKVPDKAYLVTTAHDEKPFYFIRSLAPLLHSLQGIIFLSEEEQQLVENLYRLPEEVKKIKAGYGFTRSRDLSLSSKVALERKYRDLVQKPYFVYVGRVTAVKGCMELIHAFCMMRSQYRLDDVELVFIGSIEINLVAWEGIHFLGILPEDEKNFLIRHSRALVNPSPLESMSIVVYEAWMQGTPVVVNGDCEVTKALCDRSSGGVYFHSKAGFQAMLNWFVKSPEKAKYMGKLGRRFVKSYCDWNYIVRQIKESF